MIAHAEVPTAFALLDPTTAGAGGRGFASPLTLPATRAVPLVPALLPVSYPDERWDPTRLAISQQPAATVLDTDDQPDKPDVDASRVVVGYLRSATPGGASGSLTVDGTEPDVTDEALIAAIVQYARERGLTLLRVHRDDVTDDDARRPGFSACLRHLYLREASAIVIPGWDHLAPNEVLRRALCHNATSAGGIIQVISTS